MTEPWQIALLTAGINAAVTWGIISTKLEWLRRDVDLAHERLDQALERLEHLAEKQGPQKR